MSSDELRDAPSGEMRDDSYVSRQGNKGETVPVQSDTDNVEDPIDENIADTDAQLERDDAEAIDKSNIMQGRTRGAKPTETYREPGDEEGIPGPEDGTSSTDQMK